MAQSQAKSERVEVAVHYEVPRWLPEWAVPEVPVPETDTHDAAIDYLKALLLAWVERDGRDAKVARNMGLRWVPEEPRAGFDPDLCLFEPAPRFDGPTAIVKLWDHAPPKLAIEVVSPGHPYKDYVDAPERAAASGVSELWIYDPILEGPRRLGGPYLLQVWRKTDAGRFERLYAGLGPAYSDALHAWLHPQASRLPTGAKLRIGDRRDGTELWRTVEEQERLAHEQERLAREEALKRIEALERELARRRD
jgi:Uma2 family endonuclease